MDMFTLGLVGIGAAGGMLWLVGLLDRLGIPINETVVTFALEALKYGGIFYLLSEMAKVFL